MFFGLCVHVTAIPLALWVFHVKRLCLGDLAAQNLNFVYFAGSLFWSGSGINDGRDSCRASRPYSPGALFRRARSGEKKKNQGGRREGGRACEFSTRVRIRSFDRFLVFPSILGLRAPFISRERRIWRRALPRKHST